MVKNTAGRVAHPGWLCAILTDFTPTVCQEAGLECAGGMLGGRLALALESCRATCLGLSPPGSQAATAGPGKMLLCCI